MLLHIVRRDHGAAICNRLARGLNIPAHRDGNQPQFASRPVPEASDTRLADLIAWMRSHATDELAITDLASRAAMSPRTFFRRFREATGRTPYEWLVAERIAIARQLLEEGSASIDQISFLAGFSGAETMRLHFRRILGCTPADYRRRSAPPLRAHPFAEAAE